jgi:hypothetical protein
MVEKVTFKIGDIVEPNNCTDNYIYNRYLTTVVKAEVLKTYQNGEIIIKILEGSSTGSYTDPKDKFKKLTLREHHIQLFKEDIFCNNLHYEIY